MPFDINGARQAGYSDSEITDYLGQEKKFDTKGARQAGYSDAELLTHLSTPTEKDDTSEFSNQIKRTGERVVSGLESGARNLLWNMPVGGISQGLRSLGGVIGGESLKDALSEGRRSAESISIDPILDRITGNTHGQDFGNMVGEGYDIARQGVGKGAEYLSKLKGETPEQQTAARSTGEGVADIAAILLSGARAKGKTLSPEAAMRAAEEIKKRQGGGDLSLTPKEPLTPVNKTSQELSLVPKGTRLNFNAEIPETASGLLPKAPNWAMEGEPRPESPTLPEAPLPELGPEAWGHLSDEASYQARAQELPTGERPLPELNFGPEDQGVPLHPDLDPIQKQMGLERQVGPEQPSEFSKSSILDLSESPETNASRAGEGVVAKNFQMLPERLQADREVSRLNKEIQAKQELLSRFEDQAHNEQYGEPTKQIGFQKQNNKLNFEGASELPKELASHLDTVRSDIRELQGQLADRLEQKHGIPNDGFYDVTKQEGGESRVIQKVRLPKSQEGSIKFFQGDPEFEAFKKTLPKNLHGEAKEMWKVIQRSTDPALKLTNQENVRALAKNIPGINDAVEKVADISTPWQEVRKQTMFEKDIPGNSKSGLIAMAGDLPEKAAQQLYGGGRLYGFAKDNTFIKYGVQQINQAFSRANAWIGEQLLKKGTGLQPMLEALKKEDQGKLWHEMLKAEGKYTLTDDALRAAGVGPEGIKAHTRYREVMDEVFNRVNAERVKQGHDPLPKRLSYIPSRFLGDFTFEVHAADGTLIHLIGTKTVWGANSALKFMQEKHPDYTFSKVEHRPPYRALDKQSVYNGYQQMLEILAKDDPRVETLENTFKEWEEKTGWDAFGYKRHFLNKRVEPVKGFEGNKEWLSMEKNAKEGFEASITYAEMGSKWLEMQEAKRSLKEMFADPEVVGTKDQPGQQPNAARYLHLYVDNALGKTGMLGKLIDSTANAIAGKAGWGGTTQTNALRFVKKWMTMTFLGFHNIAFAGSQAIQPMQVVNPWLTYLGSRGAGGNSILAWGKASGDLAAHITRQHDMVSGGGKEALDWALKNHRLDSHIMDELRNASEKSLSKGIESLAGKSITVTETYSRMLAYMVYDHYLRDSGLTGEKLHSTAANLTDMSMTDYQLHERPMVYKQLGVVGEMMSSLTTFKHNQYSQLAGFGKQNKQALAMQLGVSLLMAGTLGFYGREEIDSLINLWNRGAASAGWDARMPTTGETILKHTKDNPVGNFIAFGAVSTITGMDMSSKLSNANVLPDTPMDFIFPFGQDIGEKVASAFSLIMNPDKEHAGRAGYAWAPNSLKGVAEIGLTKDGVVMNPKTGEGDYKRGPVAMNQDWIDRFLGGRSVTESRTRQGTYALKQEDAWQKNLQNTLIEKAKKTDNPDTRADLMKRYVKLGGTPDNFIAALLQHQLDKRKDMFQREQGNPNSTSGILKFKRGQEYK